MDIMKYYQGRRVLLTGHTGFKGSWLVTWLHRMGAEVTGFSIDVPTTPSLFDTLGIADLCNHHFGDINDLDSLSKLVREGQFDTVFHLAAQPLVRLSYAEPLGTLATNVMGTANLLEAVRAADHPCAVLVVTSDKCYENLGSLWGFRETDAMGGSDPYSMSKGAAELVVSAWRRSFFSTPDSTIRIATARAGNVIGGGDWAQDRIVPDCIEALKDAQPIQVRNPFATRPWQHVVEPLSGYLLLGALLSDPETAASVESGWNFGPQSTDVRTVQAVVETMINEWGSGAWQDASQPNALKEAATLGLNCEKAAAHLDWHPVWPFERAVAETAKWYKVFHTDGVDAVRATTLEQIAAYEAASPVFSSDRKKAS